jgi:dethiobiotin synthetase
MSRPRRLIAVVGTHTDVGKTWCSQQLLSRWRAQGMSVAARKPVQSFAMDADTTDAERLASATAEDPRAVCPPHRWYARAMAPPMAADVLGLPRIRLDDLIAEIAWPAAIEIGLVETAGGVRSPVAHDGDSIELVRRLQPDRVLLVADAGLGTINAVRLSSQCLADLPTVVLLNRFDPQNALHVLNLEWLRTHDASRAVTSIEAALSCLHHDDASMHISFSAQ